MSINIVKDIIVEGANNIMKKGALKALAVAMGIVFVGSSLVPAVPVHAAEDLPTEITLPIVLRDFDADNLLFEYILEDDMGQHFTMTSEVFDINVSDSTRTEAYTNTYYMQGLVENELSSGTHSLVYKQDTVEQVAKLVWLNIMMPAADAKTTRFANLRTELLQGFSSETFNIESLTDNVGNRLLANYFFNEGASDEEGWTLDIADYTTDAALVKTNTGDIVWAHMYGIKHEAAGTNVLTKTLTGLDAGVTYTLAASFENSGIGVTVKDGNGDVIDSMTFDTDATNGTSQDVTAVKKDKTLTFSGETDITIEVSATGVCLLNSLTLKNNSTGEERNLVLYTNGGPELKFTNSDWLPKDGTLTASADTLQDASGKAWWRFEGDGIMNLGDSTTIYKYVTLTPGKEYVVNYNPSGGQSLKINIFDENGNVLLENVKSGYTITPTGTGVVRVEVTGTGNEAYATDWTQSKLVDFSFIQMTDNLGSYADSQAKFADSAKGWDDFETCMDYAYFVLNNLYTTRTGLNTPYDGYTGITLSAIPGKAGSYGFYANASSVGNQANVYGIKYDNTNKTISNTASGSSIGLFPLDGMSSVDAGTNFDEVAGSGVAHNFHYSMYSHANFVYSDDLYFHFVGDDDVYLFIDGKLAMDIGGAHLAVDDTVYLKDLGGLVEGESYSFDFFYLERCTGFSNLAIETNIQLLDDGSLELNMYDKDGKEIESGSVVAKDSEVQLEYEFRANVDNVTGLNFKDAKLGVEIGTAGLTLGNSVQLKDNKVVITVEDGDGNVISKEEYTSASDVQNYFNNLTLAKNSVVKISNLVYTMSSALNAQVSVAYTSPDYTGINSTGTSKTANASAGLTLATSGTPGSTTGTPTGGTTGNPSGSTSGGDTQDAGDGAGSKVPNTSDAAPIGLCVTAIFVGVAFMGIGTLRKKKA